MKIPLLAEPSPCPLPVGQGCTGVFCEARRMPTLLFTWHHLWLHFGSWAPLSQTVSSFSAHGLSNTPWFNSAVPRFEADMQRNERAWSGHFAAVLAEAGHGSTAVLVRAVSQSESQGHSPHQDPLAALYWHHLKLQS